MEARLSVNGLATVSALCSASQTTLRRAWGGIGGEYLYRWLRGEETADVTTERFSIGHSHVLAPADRTLEAALALLRDLLARAAKRLRAEDFWATGMTLHVAFDQFIWEARAQCVETRDTASLLTIAEELWLERPEAVPSSVSLTLQPLIPASRHQPTFFDDPRREILSRLIDSIQDHYGERAIYLAALQKSLGRSHTRIAFTRIPTPDEFERELPYAADRHHHTPSCAPLCRRRIPKT